MQAKQFVSLVRGRRIGKGKWQCPCPAHGVDRHPSLQITEGRRGILLKCWSHDCSPESICEALGLKVSDLFYESRPTDPKSLREAQRQVLREEAEKRREKLLRGVLCDQARFWDGEVRRLGNLFQENLEDVRIARRFHWTLDRLRESQARIAPYFHPLNVPGEIP